MNQLDVSEIVTLDILREMKELNIDPFLSYKFLKNLNLGKFNNFEPLVAKSIPEIDSETIININSLDKFKFNFSKAKSRLQKLGIDINLKKYGNLINSDLILTRSDLKNLGVDLAPYVAYGILNGGSASSYFDKTKNKKMFGSLYDIYSDFFEKIACSEKGKPKAITPAYTNSSNQPGASFMLLKFRGLLIKTLKYLLKNNLSKTDKSPYKVFQMDSVLNSKQLNNAIKNYKKDPLIRDLIEETGFDITNIYSETQPLLSALTTKKPYQIFTGANNENSLIPMPAGHGHNFYVLKSIYKRLLDEGKRFVYLTNIDNVANLVDETSLAYFVLSGKKAAFEFSVKTKVDKKGGIALIDQNNKLNCGDIGVAISNEEINKAEQKGKTILFNTAIGLFDLEYLVDNIDNIINYLPVRHSIQNKDLGKYSQLEQITWEVIGMIDDPLIFAVDKFDRFVAAKTFIESLMASGLELNNPEYPEEFKKLSEKLHSSLVKKLKTDYGLELKNNKWVPKPIDQLKQEIIKEFNEVK